MLQQSEKRAVSQLAGTSSYLGGGHFRGGEKRLILDDGDDPHESYIPAGAHLHLSSDNCPTADHPVTPTLQHNNFTSDYREQTVMSMDSQMTSNNMEGLTVRNYAQKGITSQETPHRQSSNGNTTVAGVENPHNIIERDSRGISIYQPAPALSESGGGTLHNDGVLQPVLHKSHTVNNYGVEASFLENRPKPGGNIGDRSLLSLSSFMPSAHILSQSAQTSQMLHHQHPSSSLQYQLPRSPIGENGAPLPLDAWHKISSTAAHSGVTGPAHASATDQSDKDAVPLKERKEKLDQNFLKLMQQNQKLEQEIRQMNSQFTERQNKRIADAQQVLTQNHNQAAATTAAASQSQAITPVSPAETAKETTNQNVQSQSETMIGASQTKMHEGDDGKLVMTHLQSSFDERCQRTKNIVTQLAQRLHSVKRDTFTELDKIQSRQESKSNSNSRSPNPAARSAALGNTAQGGSSNFKRQSSLQSQNKQKEPQCVRDRDFGTPFGTASGAVSLQKVRPGHSDRESRNRLDQSQNLVEALEGVSAILTAQTNTNNVSVTSTACALNFRQLKPQDSTHTSCNETPLRHRSPSPTHQKKLSNLPSQRASQGGGAFDQQNQEPLCFDNSPVRKLEESSNFPQKVVVSHESQRKVEQPPPSQQQLIDTTNNSNMVNGQQKAAFNESLMQLIPRESQDSRPNEQQDSFPQRFSFQMQQEQYESGVAKKEELSSAGEDRQQDSRIVATRATVVMSPSTFQFRQNQEGQNQQTLGPDYSPQNVNGAAQLSNILQQINNCPTTTDQSNLLVETQKFQNSELPLQQQTTSMDLRAVMQTNQHNTVSPRMGGASTAQPCFFLSHDTRATGGGPRLLNPTQPIMLTQSTPKNPTLLSSKLQKTGMNQFDKAALVVSEKKNTEKEAADALNQLQGLVTDQQFSQNADSRQEGLKKESSLGQQTTYTLDGMTVRTFDKMHVEIMQLQDKIKFLENHLKTDQSQHNQTLDRGQTDLKKTQETLVMSESSSLPYKHDSKHCAASVMQTTTPILKMTVPKTVDVQPVSKDEFSPLISRRTLQDGPASVSHVSTSQVAPGAAMNKQDDKTIASSYGISQHQQQQHQMTSYRVEQPQSLTAFPSGEVEEDHGRQQRSKSRSQVEHTLKFISTSSQQYQTRKNSAGNLLYGVPQSRTVGGIATFREKSATREVLTRGCDANSHSQPDLTKLRNERKRNRSVISVKTDMKPSRNKSPSRRSSKTRSPKSGRSSKRMKTTQKNTSYKADKKTIESKKTFESKKLSVGSNLPLQMSKKPLKSKDLNSVATEFMEMPSAKAVQFKDTLTNQEDGEEFLRRRQSVLTDAYVVTNSDYDVSDQAITVTHRDGSQMNVTTSPPRRNLSSNQANNPTITLDGDQYKNSTLVDCQGTNNVDEGSENALSSNFEVSINAAKTKHKQTFPLRVRKNQNFPKGPDCSSIQSSSANHRSESNNAIDSSAQQQQQQQQQQADMSPQLPSHLLSTSDNGNNTYQDHIIREYQDQIETNGKNKSHSNTRNQQQIQHNSELALVENPDQFTVQLFNRALTSKDAQHWSNQTSTFKIAGMNVDDEDGFKKKGRIPVAEVTKEGEMTTDDDEDVSLEDERLEMRPMQLEKPEKKDSKQKKQTAKSTSKHHDMPLQQQSQAQLYRQQRQTSESNKVAWLEQRNRHLELELKRHQVHLATQDDLASKYKSLKIDYKQMLQSFERSEEIRREQKELINEQQSQMKILKSRLRREESRAMDLGKELDTVTDNLRLISTSGQNSSAQNLSALLSLTKGQPLGHQHIRSTNTNAAAERNNTQPMMSKGYQSGDSGSRSPSEENVMLDYSSSQLTKSQLHSSNYMTNQTNGGGYQHQSKQHSNSHSHHQQSMQPQQNQESHNQMMLANSQQHIYGNIASGGMLDVQMGSGNDLVIPEGYSVLYDLEGSESMLQQPKKLKSSSRHRSRSNSERKHRRRKSHKKKHRKSGKKHAREIDYSRSNSTSRRSGRNSSHRSKHCSELPLQQQAGLNQSTISHRPPKHDNSQHHSAKQRSRSKRKSKKRTHRGSTKDYNNQGQILNIQTSPTSVMRGVHNFKSTQASRTSLADQAYAATEKYSNMRRKSRRQNSSSEGRQKNNKEKQMATKFRDCSLGSIGIIK